MHSAIQFKRVWDDGEVQYGTIDFDNSEEMEYFNEAIYDNRYDPGPFEIVELLLILF